MTTGVVLARTGSTYRVDTDRGEVTATLRGRLKHQDGDRVMLEPAAQRRQIGRAHV